MNYNKATIIGRLTRDPELKALPSGTHVANLSVVTNSSYKKDDKKVEQAEFHNAIVFGVQAENCAKWLHKGQVVMVEGRLQTRSWEVEGKKMYRTEIIAQSVQFGPKSVNQGVGEENKPIDTIDATTGEKIAPGADKEVKQTVHGIDYPTETIDPNDIPF